MNKDVIPKDIRNPKYTLMVEGWHTGGFSKMNNRAIENTLSKNYPDNYVLVLPKDTADKRYANTSKFRYYMYFNFTTIIRTSGSGAVKTGTYGSSGHGVVHVYDRLSGKYLGNTVEELQSYPKTLKFLSEFVKKNR